jgi:hypothetical protein
LTVLHWNFKQDSTAIAAGRLRIAIDVVPLLRFFFVVQSSTGKYEQLIFPCIVLGGQFYECGDMLVSLYYSGSLSASLEAAGAQIRESQHINQAPYIDVLQSFASYPYSGKGSDDIVAAGAVLVRPFGVLTISNMELFNM